MKSGEEGAKPGPDAATAEALRKRLELLPSGVYDTILDCAARVLGCRAAAILLRGGERVRVRAARTGAVPAWSLPALLAATRLVHGDEACTVDCVAEPSVDEHALGFGDAPARFMAVAPLHCRMPGEEGAGPLVGTLIMIDDRAHPPRDEDSLTLHRVGAMAAHLLGEALADGSDYAGTGAMAGSGGSTDRRERQFQLTERLVNIGSWHLDLATGALDWSRHTFRIFGREPGQEAPDLDTALRHYPPRDREVLMQALDRAIATGDHFDLDTDIITVGGLKRRVRNIGEVEWRDGEPVGLFGVCQDVTERHYAEQALERSAKIDELTQIHNRAALNAKLDLLIAERISGGPELLLLLIDLDNFKKVNDTYGHPAGDTVLKAIAEKLELHATRLGFPARLGGDEFVLLITNELALHDVRVLLADVLADLRMDYPGDKGTIAVAATIGACWLDGDVSTRTELLKRADLALYSAKALGKGRALISGDMRPILPRNLPPMRASA